jgi:hypothetical protein
MMITLLGKDFFRVAAANSLDEGSHGIEFQLVVVRTLVVHWRFCFGGSSWDLWELTFDKLTMTVLVFWEQLVSKTDADKMSR